MKNALRRLLALEGAKRSRRTLYLWDDRSGTVEAEIAALQRLHGDDVDIHVFCWLQRDDTTGVSR